MRAQRRWRRHPENALAMTLETADLILMPYPAKDLLAIIEGQDRPEGHLAVLAAEGLRRYNVSDEVSPVWLAKLRESAAAADPWVYSFAIMHRQDCLFAGGVGRESCESPPLSRSPCP